MDILLSAQLSAVQHSSLIKEASVTHAYRRRLLKKLVIVARLDLPASIWCS